LCKNYWLDRNKKNNSKWDFDTALAEGELLKKKHQHVYVNVKEMTHLILRQNPRISNEQLLVETSREKRNDGC
jgi:hypothetical protein